MSYLVLARKYRPKTFPQMVGQAHVVQALTDAGYAVVQLPGVVVETEDEHTQ